MNSRLIIIDAYNVIHRSAELRPGPQRTLEESRRKLINLVSWAYGTGDARFLVVFDGATGVGKGGDETGGRVEVRWAKPPDKADDVIRRVVEDQIDRDVHVTVVTSDLEVARHARSMGADVSIADLFLASAVDPAAEVVEKPHTLTKREIEEWAELFKMRQGSSAPTGDPELDS